MLIQTSHPSTEAGGSTVLGQIGLYILSPFYQQNDTCLRKDRDGGERRERQRDRNRETES